MPPETRPLRIAVVGAGPAGLYTADQFTYDEKWHTVHLFDRLPVPFGLLRYGVAPDHPTIKSASETFQEILDRPNVGLFCNVEIGRDLTADELRSWYDAVVYATGADSDRRLGIEGEDLPGSISATDFVKWYNGHPEAPPRTLADVRTAVVIGAGNVALDVARILVKDPEALSATDIPADALSILSSSAVTDVHLIARRGPEYARFTTKELRELGDLGGVDVVVDPSSIPEADPEGLGSVGRRNLKVLRDWAMRAASGARRRVHLHFGVRPNRLLGERAVRGIRLDSDGSTIDLAADLVVRAIGYRSRPLPGVPFDESTGTIPHVGHRVQRDGTVSIGEYAVGWVKRGPTGILGTNRGDAADTAEILLADFATRHAQATFPEAEDELSARGIRFLDKTSWTAVRRAEEALGAAHGRDRVKITSWDALVAVGDTSRAVNVESRESLTPSS
jgi:ferredoxin--NADP+ reductase